MSKRNRMDDVHDIIQSKIAVSESGCWNWPVKKGNRYGTTMIEGTTYLTHRLSYQLHHGDIPDGFWVCPQCEGAEHDRRT